VLRVRVLVRWLCAGVRLFGGFGGFLFGGGALGRRRFASSAVQPTQQCMVGATASLWLVGRMGKSLTKAFKEQGKTIKGRVQGVYQGKKHLQSLVPDDYFEFDE
jgi:hypothetical protein